MTRFPLIYAVFLVIVVANAFAAPTGAADYLQHFSALSKLSVAVADAMPPAEYNFRPDPPSMTFGELMSHIAVTNYQFCAGLKDVAPPNLRSPTEKEDVVKFLRESFDYCSSVIPNLTDEQIARPHDSPDGRMPGREVLLAMYVHIAHHRGQAEIYLRDKGIAPPQYRF